MPTSDRQREFALEVARKLRSAGFQSLWAGGCVRDQLMGITPKDYDVATNATPNEVREVFGRRRTLPIGASFGVITVLGRHEAGQLDVATFRTDASYTDGRHPDSVAFTTAEHDAQRRDFTINGLFFDPIAETVIDYVDGQQDLAAGIVRAIGDPSLRIAEDKLRMLRAVRFAAAFDFSIADETFAAVRQMAPQIHTVSAERIGAELRRMLLDPHRATAISLLRDTGLLAQVLPEVNSLSSDSFSKLATELGSLDSPSLPLALATLLSRCETNIADEVGRRLRYTNKENARAEWLIVSKPRIAEAQHLPWPKLQRLLTHDGVQDLLAIHQAIAGPASPALAFCRERLAWPAERLNPQPLLDGSALIRHGLSPGPHFSGILECVRDAQLNGEINSLSEALALADRLRAND